LTTKISKGIKGKVKRQSKGVRLHVRRLKQEERKESLPVPPKKQRGLDNPVVKVNLS
jgi:hypothetical protein